MGNLWRSMTISLLGLLFLRPEIAPGQDFRQEKGGGDDPKGEEDPQPKVGSEDDTDEPTELQKRVLGLFTATKAEFEKEKITLVYNFESENQDLTMDWRPELQKTKGRIRWAGPVEGTLVTVEDGIILGDKGEWYHKAVFLPDVEVTVDMMPVSQHRTGNILAPVFYNDRKKSSLGSNCGSQFVCLSGFKLLKPPLPKDVKVMQANTRLSIGYRYDGRVFECVHSKKKLADSAKVPKLIEGFDRGRVGLAWNGSIQCFIFSVTIKGKLDPNWVAKQLGEKEKGK